MVLTLKTSEITTYRCDGERCRSREEMKNGFLFNGVHIQGDRTAKDEGIEFSFPVFPHSADASFRWRDGTPMVAEGTLHLPSFQRAIKHCFLHIASPVANLSCLEDLHRPHEVDVGHLTIFNVFWISDMERANLSRNQIFFFITEIYRNCL